MTLTYGLYIFDDVAKLDFVGPHEVFCASAHLLQSGKVITVAESAAPVTTAFGMQVIPDHTFYDAPPVDVLLIPGVVTPEAARRSERAMQWIRDTAAKARFTTAVCTGSLILQRAGLLAGKRATTHWQLVPELEKATDVTVLPDMRYVRDGNIVTSQGVSAGIDMALWLVGQLHSPDHAREVRKLLQYDPAPPYTAEV